MAVCPACGAAVTKLDASSLEGKFDSTTDAAVTAAAEEPASALAGWNRPQPFPRARATLLLLNVTLLLMAVTLGALDVLGPIPAKGQAAPQLVLPTASAPDSASDSPVFTVSAPTPRPTNTTTSHQGSPHPSAPTATVPSRPTATPVPTTVPTPAPSATPTPPNGGG